MNDSSPAESDAQNVEHHATPQDNLSITQHRLKAQKLNYTALTGTLVLKEEREAEGEQAGNFEGDKPRAEVFFISYTLDGVKDSAERPITFIFNGGPGSSSVWLHMGVFGPRRVVMNDVEAVRPPYELTDNAHTLLKDSDLVFIDPVSTGFSRPVTGEKAKAFHTLKKDLASVGDFIRLYTTRYARWNSPKFLAGESYGTARAAAISLYLQERHGLYLNGLMLVSSILNWATALPAPGNDLPYALFLPSFAATAWYHQKLPKALQDKPLREVLDEVETFALGEYTQSLLQGSSLPPADKKRVTRVLARYSGLSEAYIAQTNLRINIYRFIKELLRDERKTVGRLDARITGYDLDAAGEHIEQDPSLSLIMGPYSGAFNHYVRAELGFESDLPYEILKGIYKTWSFESDNEYVNVAEDLRKAIAMNPQLQIFVANAYYDLATPYFATEYTFNHLGLEPHLHQNITMSYYEAGHMMYVHPESLRRLSEDVSAFVKNSG